MPQQKRTGTSQVASAYQIFSVIGPTEGLDLRTSPTLLKPGQATLLTNYSLAEPGALKVRPGFVVFSTSSLGAGAVQGAARVYLATAVPATVSTIFTVVGWNQTLQLATDSGGWGAVALSGLTTSALSFPNDRDLVACLDGSTRLMKSTNGSSWTRFGIDPGPKSTLAAVSGGALSTGEFEVNYTYKDRDLAFESNGSSAVSTITLTSTATVTIEVQVPNSTDVQIDAIVLYARNKSAGETVRRKVSSFARIGGASSATSSTSRITSSAWTAGDPEPTNHTPPPVLSFGVVWKNRWWARHATIRNRIHFTELFQPESWPALFYIDIPFVGGDDVNALVPLGDTMIICGTTKLFVIVGQTSLDFEVRPAISSQGGALGFRAAAILENGVVHASAGGVYLFDGATDRLLSYSIEPGWRDLIANTAASNLALVGVTYHAKEKELRIAVPRRFPSGAAGEWVLDLNRTRLSEEPAWTETDRTIGGYIPWDGPESQGGVQGRLFSWDPSVGRLFEEGSGTSANSSNLTASYEGPGLNVGIYMARFIDLRGELEPNAGTFSAEVVVDGVSAGGAQSIGLGSKSASYGVAEYGIDVYGGTGRKSFYVTLPLGAEGRTAVVKTTYTGKAAFKWFAYHLGFVPESHPRAFAE